MNERLKPPFRADHVGSLLRPQSLLDMRARASEGEVSAEALRAHEDECITQVINMQQSLGLRGVSDGEFRRESFHGDFIGRLNGVDFKLFDPGGNASGVAPFTAVVSEKIGWPEGGIEVENFRFLKQHTTATAKQTIPSPTMTHFRGGRAAIDELVYPQLDSFFADLAGVYREEIAGLASAGCDYIQMDDTNLAYLCDQAMRSSAEQRGEDVDQLPHDYARLINDSIRERPADMSVCVHLCRGNARSRWFAQGGYEPVAEIIFNEIDVDGFFLEYDDERSGDFAPLRFVPQGKVIVLGLLTTKHGELESKDAIKRRVDEASRYVPMEQLCLSPQCGFASAVQGNLLSEDDQQRKLAMVVELGDEIWS